jgi:hypothetical protein
MLSWRMQSLLKNAIAFYQVSTDTDRNTTLIVKPPLSHIYSPTIWQAGL